MFKDELYFDIRNTMFIFGLIYQAFLFLYLLLFE